MATLFFWFLYIAYALVLTYLVLGFIISFEFVAAMCGGKFALKWISKHFTYEQLYWSVIIFYPMLRLSYFFLEYIPSFLTHDVRCKFNLDYVFKELFPHH